MKRRVAQIVLAGIAVITLTACIVITGGPPALTEPAAQNESR